jgi:hypothetical protein
MISGIAARSLSIRPVMSSEARRSKRELRSGYPGPGRYQLKRRVDYKVEVVNQALDNRNDVFYRRGMRSGSASPMPLTSDVTS